ncbi:MULTISPECIES: hypothetical protein [Campylobacter]|uniref:Uncharacterized protein n=1 Tax=Campylobacter porcelli TaxID=1660073 RepID=A0ABU7M3X0_9BACT|nr:hypothetical protein [Campylobacter sp. P0124]MCR8696941.1 hypothetical protein [Campylobacter sp. RM19073]MEE3744400.1 hypothetical protein [Campylobacter sp. CX2-4855-23]
MDFLDSLKEIKGNMLKEQKATPKQSNPNKDEIKDIFDEDPVHKEARLRDEFMEFIKYSDIKKLD